MHAPVGEDFAFQIISPTIEPQYMTGNGEGKQLTVKLANINQQVD